MGNSLGALALESDETVDFRRFSDTENNDGEIVENNDDVDVAHSTIEFIVIVAMYERNRLCNDVNTVHDESAERR